MQAMPVGLFHLPLVLAQVAAQPSAALPSGSSSAFRERMMDWSAEVEAPVPTVVRLPQTQAERPGALPRLSSRFGHRSDPLHGRPRMHSGIDIPGPPGTPIRASEGGFVRFAGTAGGYGQMVEIAHGNGLSTRYAHLSRILVRPGDPVVRGETIALMGSTGRSTGSHLHFEVRSHGRAANPLAYFDGGAAFAETSYTVWRARTEPYISQFARARAAARPPAAESF